MEKWARSGVLPHQGATVPRKNPNQDFFFLTKNSSHMNTTEKRRLGSQRAEAYSDGLKPRTANPPKIEPRNFILFKLIEAQPNTSNYSPRTKNGSPTGIFPFPLGLYQPNPIPPRPQRIRGERRGHASAAPPHDTRAGIFFIFIF